MRILPYACQHVTVLYIKHGLSIVTCFLGGVGVVVAKEQALYEHGRGLEHARVHYTSFCSNLYKCCVIGLSDPLHGRPNWQKGQRYN